MKEIREEFASINEMLRTIESRNNNSVMNDRHSSFYNDYSFTGTHSYDEAIELFRNGDKDKYYQINQGLRTSNDSKTALLPRRQVRNGVVGYAPNVPNAIMGLPNSMIYTEKVNMKSKTVSILYSICGNCGVKSHTFIRCGIALLNAVNALELSGYRVEIKILFFNAVGSNEKTRGLVTVKRYNEHLDLLKMAFPLANPSMFRRFGFKWIETQPELTDGYYNGGYGSDNSDEDLSEGNTIYLTLNRIQNCDCDAMELLEKYFKK